MKYTFFTFLLISNAFLLGDQIVGSTTKAHLENAVQRVETARAAMFSTLNSVIDSVEYAKKKGTENNHSIATKIIETNALSEIAKSTADVEITKAKAISLITQAVDKLSPDAANIIADAVSSVEVVKAQAKENIIKATGRVELSKLKAPVDMKYPQEALTVAKNVAAIQIAKSVAKTDVARAVSFAEVTKSSMQADISNAAKSLTHGSKEALEEIKAKATAKISSYLANIEVTKANMLSKIAQEVAKVEIATFEIKGSDKTEENDTTYPKQLLQVD